MSRKWTLVPTERFARDLSRLDKTAQRRVVDALEAVIALEDPRQRGKALVGELAGSWRYRVGDYRVIALLRDDEMVVIALTVGHRSKVYRA
ncbi:MAG: type II toxin-antitoxin system RelE/ParE family toxin [Bifidobacteriaceae bacterium]|nr:type II toxin-antitoxin system RelE/ParE family toxin [Bifidobacteriaceae bacterium]